MFSKDSFISKLIFYDKFSILLEISYKSLFSYISNLKSSYYKISIYSFYNYYQKS